MARQALGKGLNALIPGHLRDLDAPAGGTGQPQELAIAEIRPNPYQPRTVFRPELLKELADSLKEQGLLQPVLVVRASGGGYELISGERRVRAAQTLGWQRIPAIIKVATAQEMAEWAIIENVQRDDLNPLEEARSYKRLIDEFTLTQEQVAQKVGRERATVANSLRLLRLPAEVQALVEKGELQMGHARALLAIASPEAQKALGQKAAREGWSVRAVEQAGQERGRPEGPAGPKVRRGPNVELAALEERLRRKMGTKVKLVPGPAKGGRIEVHYYSAEELERLLDLLG
jgi:ParB family chromosome partitioning protein